MVNNLKKSVVSTFGTSIKNVSDLKSLKLDIYRLTSKELGFNTLRRLFGFLPYTKPNNNTLNILSNYVGYESFIVFIKKFKLDREWNDWDYINDMLLENELSKNHINWLIRKKSSNQYYKLLTYLISSLILKKDASNLSIIFENEKLFTLERSEIAKISTTLSKKFKSSSPLDFNWIYSLLCFKSFRDIMLYSYVDVDTLSSYYGNLLKESLLIIQNEDEILFTKLMLEFDCFVREIEPEREHSNYVVPKNCHPILLGRYYSVLYFKSKATQRKIFNQILNEAKTQKSRIEFFQEIIPIFIILKELDKIELIFDLYYDELLDYDYWDHIHIERYNLVALILIHIKNGRLKLIPDLFSFFNEETNFHINDCYQKILFYIAKYHFLKLTKKTLKKTKNQYLEMVQKTGFVLFDENYLLNYFDQ